ncbi:hypothetical protein FI667_g13074, partial [Globisporangium splendens]
MQVDQHACTFEPASQATRGAAQSPVLPPIYASPSSSQHIPHAQQQRNELETLVRAFCDRLRTHQKLHDFQSMRDMLTRELDATVKRTRRSVDDGQGGVEEHAYDDCFVFLKHVSTILATHKYPFAGQFVEALTRKIQNLVHERRHEEAIDAAAHANASPRALKRSNEDAHAAVVEADSNNSLSEDEDEVDSDNDGASSSSDDVKFCPNDHPTVAGERVRGVEAPKGNTFRNSLRCRKFPPTRVPKDEHIVTSCTYTPFDHSKNASDLSSIRLESSGINKGKQWYVVQFPKFKPSVSRPETEALIQWASAKLAAYPCLKQIDDDTPPETTRTYVEAQTRFQSQLALYEHICYELSRLIFDKYPTTARFIHGLFVELIDTALCTVANADRDAQINEQRHMNVRLELQRLKSKLDAVKTSLVGLEETLMKRQRHLLSERERIIRQRKKLNLLLCADQILIRGVAGLIQHALDQSEELLTSLSIDDDPHGLIAGHALVHTSSPTEGDTQRFQLVDELYDLVKIKYQSLREVHQAILRVEETRAEEQEQEAEAALSQIVVDHMLPALPVQKPQKDQVIVLDMNEVVTATEDFKCALRRLSRLVSKKSPDSSVGWEPQELWDQALFIPLCEDIQDLDRDVQRLCRHVETNILQRRHGKQVKKCHATVQTDISACVNFRPRNRANGFVAFPTSFTFEVADLDTPAMSQPGRLKGAVGATATSEDSTQTRSLREEHHELLGKFLPAGFQHFVAEIPADYVPHQLSIGVVHSIISFLFNEMWLLVQEECLRQPKPFTIVTTASNLIPVASIHECIYRIYLLHFRDPAFVTCRLLDLLVSASRLDTQSCKVLLFCRLVNLPGVDPLPKDAFWFVLKTIHILQRACASTGNYFHLDASGENEFIPQASATEALNHLFHGATNDVMKRLRLRLSGLASVYGTIWIPAYNIIEFVMEEWESVQDTIQMTVKEKIAQEQEAAAAASLAPDAVPADRQVPTFDVFLKVFADLHLKVHRLEAAKAYRLLLNSSKQVRKHRVADTQAIDVDLFVSQWTQLIIQSINQAQQQQFNSPSQHSASTNSSSNTSAGTSSGIHFGAASDALIAANRHLSYCFLKATWEQTKKDFICWLNVDFRDIGLQVRLVQQMDNVVNQDEAATQLGWKSLQQIIQITSVGNPDNRAER